MSAWVLIPCLVNLRAEFNALSPNRDKGADGSIGDSAHTSSSDHTPDEDSDKLRGKDADSRNEVHALDIDSSGPWPGTGTQKQRFHRIVMAIIAGERAKWLDPDDKCRLRYVIWDRKIYHLDTDFEPRDYDGDDPHENHGHFSGRYDSDTEADQRPWGVYVEEDDGMAEISQARFNELMSGWWNTKMRSDLDPPSTELNYLRRAPWNLVTTAPDTMYARLARVEAFTADATNDLVAVQAALAQILDRLPPAS